MAAGVQFGFVMPHLEPGEKPSRFARFLERLARLKQQAVKQAQLASRGARASRTRT
jgi:hypothetical protein